MKRSRAIDCHVHVIDPLRFRYDDGPGYRPKPWEIGTCENYDAAIDRTGILHALLVQPSCYGFDNSALLDAMRRYPGRFKSVAMVDAMASDEELVPLADAGVVGLRFNLVSFDPDVFRRPETNRLLERIKMLDWFAEVVADEEQWRQAAGVLAKSGVKVLVDHFGLHGLPQDPTRPGFQDVLALGRAGNAVVKLTTPFALGLPRQQHHLVDRFVEALLDAFGAERCVWGSDWPFLAVADPPDLEESMNYICRWVPEAALREQILWRNPVRMFGFEDTGSV